MLGGSSNLPFGKSRGSKDHEKSEESSSWSSPFSSQGSSSGGAQSVSQNVSQNVSPASTSLGSSGLNTGLLSGSATGAYQNVPALFSKDCSLVGKLVLKRSDPATLSVTATPAYIIEGAVEGEILADGELVIGASAHILASIQGAKVRVFGEVLGDISCSERLELLAGANVRGNIAAPVIVINDGAYFEGRCSMSAEAATARTSGSGVTGIVSRVANI